MKVSKSSIISISVAAGIFLLALVCLVIGVCTHKEVTFDSNSPTWNKVLLPLGVDCISNTDPAECNIVKNVIADFNSRVRFNLFSYRDTNSVIHFRMGVPQDISSSSPPGEIYWAGDNTALFSQNNIATHCNIDLSNVTGITSVYIVSYHSLGHCVGLGHDDEAYVSSIMREVQHEDQSGTSPQNLPGLTDSDSEALRNRYN